MTILLGAVIGIALVVGGAAWALYQLNGWWKK